MNHFTHPLAMVDTPRRQPRTGDFEVEVNHHGAKILVGYDLEGVYLAETRDDPAEYPTINIVSVDMGSGPLFGEEAEYWNQLLDLWEHAERQENL